MEEKEEQRVKRTQRDYSLAFKLQVIDEVEKGYCTYKEAQRKYQIQGRSTVLIWLRKHGRLDWSNSNPMTKTGKTPAARIRELELALKRAKEDNQILQIAIDIADEQLGTDIRKKYLPKQSEEHKLRK
jgi:transposase-like protein